jgi:hypothetical protein
VEPAAFWSIQRIEANFLSARFKPFRFGRKSIPPQAVQMRVLNYFFAGSSMAASPMHSHFPLRSIQVSTQP